MTQEEKSLILRDICGRLPYGITIYRITDNSTHRIQYSDITENIDQFSHFLEYSGIDNVKPFLRPMSSITEEEMFDFHENGGLLNHHFKYEVELNILTVGAIDWLNKKGFDYRGLIPMGLAIEAKEGMYNTKQY